MGEDRRAVWTGDKFPADGYLQTTVHLMKAPASNFFLIPSILFIPLSFCGKFVTFCIMVLYSGAERWKWDSEM